MPLGHPVLFCRDYPGVVNSRRTREEGSRDTFIAPEFYRQQQYRRSDRANTWPASLSLGRGWLSGRRNRRRRCRCRCWFCLRACVPRALVFLNETPFGFKGAAVCRRRQHACLPAPIKPGNNLINSLSVKGETEPPSAFFFLFFFSFFFLRRKGEREGKNKTGGVRLFS